MARLFMVASGTRLHGLMTADRGSRMDSEVYSAILSAQPNAAKPYCKSNPRVSQSKGK